MLLQGSKDHGALAQNFLGARTHANMPNIRVEMAFSKEASVTEANRNFLTVLQKEKVQTELKCTDHSFNFISDKSYVSNGFVLCFVGLFAKSLLA